jgi:UrcA family protein
MMASYGTFGETRRRQRRAAWWSVIRFLCALVAVLAVGIYGYQVGVSASQTRTAQLEADLARVQHDNLDLHDRLPQRPSSQRMRRRRWRACGSALLRRSQAAKRPICSRGCGRS